MAPTCDSAGSCRAPAVALLAGDDCGAVISASHNPPEYNGVKFFAGGGRKLSDEEEEAVERLLDDPSPRSGGRHDRGAGRAERVRRTVEALFDGKLGGLRLVVDCANGAMTDVAPRTLENFGAHVVTIGNEPDGTNINVGLRRDRPLPSREVVRAGDVDLGVAFDGDGDRMLAVDAAGNEVDGDQILAVIASHLGVDLVAVTEMTNLGFHQLMQEQRHSRRHDARRRSLRRRGAQARRRRSRRRAIGASRVPPRAYDRGRPRRRPPARPSRRRHREAPGRPRCGDAQVSAGSGRRPGAVEGDSSGAPKRDRRARRSGQSRRQAVRNGACRAGSG